MKKFISGLIIGLMISATVAYAEEYSIIPNPFPIFVDGTQQEVEALNINGTTWLRLGDAGKVLGVSVLFDETNKQINITDSADVVTSSIVPAGEADVIIPNIPEVKQYSPDGLLIVDYNGNQYVRFFEIYQKYDTSIKITDEKAMTVDLLKNNQLILENVKYLIVNGLTCLELNYYESTILPLIQ